MNHPSWCLLGGEGSPIQLSPWPVKVCFSLRALGLVAMGGHIGVACPTERSIPGGTRWDTLAPHTARSTCPIAQVGPRMNTAPRLAQPTAI